MFARLRQLASLWLSLLPIMEFVALKHTANRHITGKLRYLMTFLACHPIAFLGVKAAHSHHAMVYQVIL